MLPVAEIDGRVVTESDRILFELEDLYKDRVPLVPTEPAAAERFARLLRLERELFGAWMQWLTSGWSDAANRANFEAVLAAVDQELFVTEGPWFCDDFTPSSPTDVLDQCYIHSDCVPPLKPIYSSQFDAWICSDGKVSLGEQFDGCFIHSGTGRTRARVRARGTERDLPSA